MRAAAILGLGCSPKDLHPFQTDKSLDWQIGVPATNKDADVVLLFGGDGTIHRHLAQLVRLGLPVLIVPAGSGNDFARALGFRRTRESPAAWQKWIAGEQNIRNVDLGEITPVGRNQSAPTNSTSAARYFCCVAGVGLDSEVARRANQLPRWLRGNGGYALSLMPTIFSFAPLPMKIWVPEAQSKPGGLSSESGSPWVTRSDQPTMLAAFANTSTYGGGMKIAPQAKMDDGLLDVCVVGAVDPLKLLAMFPTVYAGKHLGIREVEYFQAPRLRVETDHPLDVYADGEYVCRTPIGLSVQPHALKIITP